MSEQQTDQPAETPVYPPGPYPVTEEGTPIHDQLVAEFDPDAHEPAADEDPAPVLNEDADDTFADLPEGTDDGDTDLDGDDDEQQ